MNRGTIKPNTVQGRVLAVLLRHPDGLTCDGIARRLEADKHQVGNSLSNLRQAGAVFCQGSRGRHPGVWCASEDHQPEAGEWPKKKTCLVCGGFHMSKHIGDRLHAACREKASKDDHRFLA